jgi:hypothetical protein
MTTSPSPLSTPRFRLPQLRGTDIPASVGRKAWWMVTVIIIGTEGPERIWGPACMMGVASGFVVIIVGRHAIASHVPGTGAVVHFKGPSANHERRMYVSCNSRQDCDMRKSTLQVGRVGVVFEERKSWVPLFLLVLMHPRSEHVRKHHHHHTNAQAKPSRARGQPYQIGIVGLKNFALVDTELSCSLSCVLLPSAKIGRC